MKCIKKLILTGYRVQYVDLREPKPRTPKELIHVVDSLWLDAMGVVGRNVSDHIKGLYEKEGYHVFSVEPVKPKRVAELDLCQIWNEAEQPAACDSEVCPE